MSEKPGTNGNFLEGVKFSGKANFYVNEEGNKQNCRYWSPENPHWFTDSKEQGTHTLMLWCGLWDTHVIGPFFFENTVHCDNYLKMVGDEMVTELDLIGEQPKWFMQDGAHPHYETAVCHWLDDMFPHRWIWRRGPEEWAPPSPDLNPLDFAFWGFLKAQVYAVKIRDLCRLRQRITDCCATVRSRGPGFDSRRFQIF
jgi:hypothetical protein